MPDNTRLESTSGDREGTGGARDSGRVVHRRRWVEAGVIISFWAVVALLDIAQNTIDPHTSSSRGMRPGEGLYVFLEYGLWGLATPIIFRLAQRFKLDRGIWGRHLLLLFVSGVVLSAAIDLANHAFWNTLVEAPERELSLTAVLGGLHILPELVLFLIVLLAGFARDYFIRYNDRVREAARLRAEAAELQAHSAGLQAQLSDAKLQALRSQLNPHFLFNTLNTISSYLEVDPSGVRRMIARLSELLRYALEKTDVREVPLREELSFVDAYLEIQQIRFDERLSIDRNIDQDVLDAMVPNLMLQPLVENAIKHGIGHLESGGRIEIGAWRDGSHLHLRIRDNGPGLAPSFVDGNDAASFGVGLRNTRDRLESMYGSDYAFTLEPADGNGAVAHIVIPFRRRPSDDVRPRTATANRVTDPDTPSDPAT